MSFSIHRRDACRICGALRRPLLPRPRPGAVHRRLRDPAGRGQRVLRAAAHRGLPACWTAQTRHDVDVSDYYRDYRYSVAASGFAQRFMARLAEETLDPLRPRPPAPASSRSGSGDGAQLAHFQQRGRARARLRAVGRPLRGVPRGGRAGGRVPLHGRDRRRDPAGAVPGRRRRVTYTFDHLPDPLPFLEAVRPVLEPRRGVLVIEVHDLEQIMERRETCLFEHEHSIYLTSDSFAPPARSRGLRAAHHRAAARRRAPRQLAAGRRGAQGHRARRRAAADAEPRLRRAGRPTPTSARTSSAAMRPCATGSAGGAPPARRSPAGAPAGAA